MLDSNLPTLVDARHYDLLDQMRLTALPIIYQLFCLLITDITQMVLHYERQKELA